MSPATPVGIYRGDAPPWEAGWETRQRELLRRYELVRAEVEVAKRRSA